MLAIELVLRRKHPRPKLSLHRQVKIQLDRHCTVMIIPCMSMHMEARGPRFFNNISDSPRESNVKCCQLTPHSNSVIFPGILVMNMPLPVHTVRC